MIQKSADTPDDPRVRFAAIDDLHLRPAPDDPGHFIVQAYDCEKETSVELIIDDIQVRDIIADAWRIGVPGV